MEKLALILAASLSVAACTSEGEPGALDDSREDLPYNEHVIMANGKQCTETLPYGLAGGIACFPGPELYGSTSETGEYEYYWRECRVKHSSNSRFDYIQFTVTDYGYEKGGGYLKGGRNFFYLPTYRAGRIEGRQLQDDEQTPGFFEQLKRLLGTFCTDDTNAIMLAQRGVDAGKQFMSGTFIWNSPCYAYSEFAGISAYSQNECERMATEATENEQDWTNFNNGCSIMVDAICRNTR